MQSVCFFSYHAALVVCFFELLKIEMKHSHGFTLIELVMVIVVLGILSVVAAPKFISLRKDSLVSTLYRNALCHRYGWSGDLFDGGGAGAGN